MINVFDDRIDAGRQLAAGLGAFKGSNMVVLGLPRGGVPVAAEVAKALDAPLDVIVVRKLGVPFRPEMAMGAIGEGGARVFDEGVIAMAQVSDSGQREVEDRERVILEARSARFRRGRPRVDLTGRIALIVDDGIATGSTARAACQVARRLGAARVILAVPVGSLDTVEHFADADEVICLATPTNFRAVGHHYRDFSPTSEDEVIVLLEEGEARAAESDDGGPQQ